jgi:hypothetical protein
VYASVCASFAYASVRGLCVSLCLYASVWLRILCVSLGLCLCVPLCEGDVHSVLGCVLWFWVW